MRSFGVRNPAIIIFRFMNQALSILQLLIEKNVSKGSCQLKNLLGE